MRHNMIIYPAMDLLEGKVVRLVRGDYEMATVYDTDPMARARRFREAGATWIHVVDLDAAKTGVPVHHELIARIRKETGLLVQLGGGIRNMETLESLLEKGIDRAVLGTAAVRDPKFVEEALCRYRDRILVSIDAREGEVVTDGWTRGSGMEALHLAQKVEAMGAARILYTDTVQDGTLTGPNLCGIRLMLEQTGLEIIASGGIGSLEDVDDVRETGIAGLVIGKALYEGKVDLAACLRNG